MLRKSSNAGAWLNRGMARVGGTNPGFGAGRASGFLIAGSGNWAEGGGFCGEFGAAGLSPGGTEPGSGGGFRGGF